LLDFCTCLSTFANGFSCWPSLFAHFNGTIQPSCLYFYVC
jgi:hypothetical protein